MRNWIRGGLMSSALLVGVSSPINAALAGQPADLNCDGDVNVLDAIKVVWCMLGMEVCEPCEGPDVCDLGPYADSDDPISCAKSASLYTIPQPEPPTVPSNANSDFTLVDQNNTSNRHAEPVSPRDYLGKVSGWYFGHST